MQGDTAVGYLLVRQPLQPVEERLGLCAAVGLDNAGHHVHPLGLAGVSGLKHRVGLADAGGGTEEDRQTPAGGGDLLGLHTSQQGIGIGPALVAHHAPRLWRAGGVAWIAQAAPSVVGHTSIVDRCGPVWRRLYRIFTPPVTFYMPLLYPSGLQYPQGSQLTTGGMEMDLVFLGLMVLFFALTWGLIAYSDRLMGGK